MKFLNALGFLTIIKIPQRFYLKDGEFSRTLPYFPLVGLIVGLISCMFFTAASFIFPLILVVILLVGLEIIITGGLHMDGIADMFDGRFSGEKDKARILEIMKKGDTGVFGILILIFTVILKIGFYYFLAVMLISPVQKLAASAGQTIAAQPAVNWLPENWLTGISGLNISGLLAFLLIAVFTPCFGRLSMLYLFGEYKPIQPGKSLSSAFMNEKNTGLFKVSSIYLSIIFAVLNIFLLSKLALSLGSLNSSDTGAALNGIILFSKNFGAVIAGSQYAGLMMIILIAVKSALVILLTFVFIIITGKFFTGRIGGINGDILGGISIITEIVFIILNYLSIRFL
ncbi:MAG: adenosylcobinamide-GDP ribazoletransferase [Actinobacteria bacterium]|nr:adenosylcobinamide-GDP ribazoletransferase [Actinomycetota bacterium]